MILNKHISSNKFEITATDIDENALRRAEMGVYPERSLREAPKEMVHKYFKKQGLHYQVSDELKKDIIFKKHNLLSDRFEQNYDLIVCRNVLIYFTEQAKQQIYHKFSQSLTENGIFFVGSTEQVFTPGEYNLKVFDTFFYEKNA